MRITKADLEKTVDRINRTTGNPLTPYTKDASGKFTSNVGNYHLTGAYGGHGLEQMDNDGGGTRSIFGYMTKRELYDRMHAYLKGMSDK